MHITPNILGNIFTSAHPQGCAAQVNRDIEFTKLKGNVNGPKRVMIIGSSMGYGLASRIVASFHGSASTIGVFSERPSTSQRPATAGWYNTAAFTQKALDANLPTFNINGDAFSQETKQIAINCIQKNFEGEIDLVIYSLAAPRRVDPITKTTYRSIIKPVGKPYQTKTLNIETGNVSNIIIEPASVSEIEHTTAVMGGDDWRLWIETLKAEDLLSEGFQTVAFSYIGPKLISPIYNDGTLGHAKRHLIETAQSLSKSLSEINGRALVSVNMALATQSSSVIPAIPLYISILQKVMRQNNLREGAIEQMMRLFGNHLADQYISSNSGLLRLDNYEMNAAVQNEIQQIWRNITTENLASLSDFKQYKQRLFQNFGFNVDGIDYTAEVDPEVLMPSI